MRFVIFWLYLLSCSVVFADVTRREAVQSAIGKVYGAQISSGADLFGKKIEDQLKNNISTCSFQSELDGKTEGESEGTSLAEVYSCDNLISNAESAGFSRSLVAHIFTKDDRFKEAVEGNDFQQLEAVLTNVYGPEDLQRVEEMDILVRQLETCEYDLGFIDRLKSIVSDIFSCESVVSFAKESGLSFFEMAEALDTALPGTVSAGKSVATAEEAVSEPTERKKRSTSKP